MNISSNTTAPPDPWTVSAIGVAMVFTVLALLAIIIALMPRLLIRRQPVHEKPAVEEKEIPRTMEKALGSEELALITTAVAAYLEYRAKALEKNPLIKQYPALARLLPLAGITFKAKLKLSLGGSEKEVEITEETPGTYKVKIGRKTYQTTIKPPEEKLEIHLTQQINK